VARFEQELLVDALKKARGNMLQAARDLRVSYRIVNYKVKKYNIDVKKYAGVKTRKKR
jgi:Nif-specific regulatory protein